MAVAAEVGSLFSLAEGNSWAAPGRHLEVGVDFTPRPAQAPPTAKASPTGARSPVPPRPGEASTPRLQATRGAGPESTPALPVPVRCGDPGVSRRDAAAVGGRRGAGPPVELGMGWGPAGAGAEAPLEPGRRRPGVASSPPVAGADPRPPPAPGDPGRSAPLGHSSLAKCLQWGDPGPGLRVRPRRASAAAASHAAPRRPLSRG